MTDSLFATREGEVARVALPVPVDALFDYTVSPDLAASAQPGCRVQVRFRQRPMTGVIVERARESGFAGRLRPVERLIDAEPAISSDLLDVLRDAAGEFLCPVGIALAAALPGGSAPRIVPGLAITPRGRQALRSRALPEAARPLLELLERSPAPAAAARRLAAPGLLRALERDGLCAARPVEQAPAARERAVRTVALAAGVDVEAACHDVLARAPRQAALLRRVAERGPVETAALGAGEPGTAGLLRALAARGLVVFARRAAPRDVLGVPLEPGRRVSLTPEQADALKPIADAIRARRGDTFLLHGVTGSGKTEVYLRAVGEALAAGRQALVLVPEITLTHQILARLRGRFGDGLAVLHSGLRPGERLEQWKRLRRGDVPIAVGARSALFAPLENLGVIVIDEEHDGAYKNDEGFRYHARVLARRRAERVGCPLVLGSATPSLESRYAADSGRLRRLVLQHRIGGRPLPAVELVDLARERERAPRGRKVILSRALERALQDTLAEGGQAIVFLNRRGFSTQVLCFDCGHAERCRDCDIALVYHASEQVLRCHYCDYRIPPPEACSGCGAPDTALLGLGTQRVEEEVRARLPEARIARLDRDTARRRGFTESVLRDLRGGRLDVVVGTQMVAKGHDFPGVRLVGVVVADLGLHLPDFRAAERTLQLLTQVAGRAGRDRTPGRVIVQTFSPDHYAIAPVASHDYESFYARELAHRAVLGYPPFGDLVHVLVSGEDLAATEAAADALAGQARSAASPVRDAPAGEAPEILGPAPAPLPRLRGRHRVQLLVKGADRAAVRRVAHALAAGAAALPDTVQASVDAYPVNML